MVRVGSEGETQAEGEDNKQHCVHSSPSVTPLHANSGGIHCVLNPFTKGDFMESIYYAYDKLHATYSLTLTLTLTLIFEERY